MYGVSVAFLLKCSMESLYSQARISRSQSLGQDLRSQTNPLLLIAMINSD